MIAEILASAALVFAFMSWRIADLLGARVRSIQHLSDERFARFTHDDRWIWRDDPETKTEPKEMTVEQMAAFLGTIRSAIGSNGPSAGRPRQTECRLKGPSP